MNSTGRTSFIFATILTAAVWPAAPGGTANPSSTSPSPKPDAREIPVFEYDETFPQPLPNHWITGTVVGIDVDSKQHIWIAHRAKTLRPDELHAQANPPLGNCVNPRLDIDIRKQRTRLLIRPPHPCIADALEEELQPLANSGLIARISKYNTNPANNPQPPQRLSD